MAGITVQEARRRFLDVLTANWGTLVVHLYKNDYTPNRGSLAANFIEADYSGYVSQIANNWRAAVQDPDLLHWFSVADALHWQNTTGAVGNQIYGYFVTDGAGIVLWAERFINPPFPMLAAGAFFDMQPVFTDTGDPQ